MKRELSAEQYLEGIQNQDLSILAMAITLIESKNPRHQLQARELMEKILPLSGESRRIGISGTPGVGKSTFLENFGMNLISKGHKIAVLAVDPTSQITGGSILGDKTRMQLLSQNDNAFIRPSPNGSTLGGIASKTREVMFLCEAFGFDTIFIETVGVGQSEIAVSHIVDFFILLMQPGSGDDLQGIKRGILEVSDLVVVNKADGDQLAVSKIAQHDYKKSLEVLQEKREWSSDVLLCSGLEKKGFKEIQDKIDLYFSSYFQKSHREEQILRWVKELLMNKFQTQLDQNKDLENTIQSSLASDQNVLKLVDRLYSQMTKGN